MPEYSVPSLPHELPRATSPKKVLLTIARLAVGVALLAYLAKSGIINFVALGRLFTAWPITVAAVSLLLFDISMMALRQCLLFRPHELHLGFGRSLVLTLISFFFATFLPGAAGGDLAKLFYAARENAGRRTEIVTIVLLDRAIGLFSLLLLPLAFAPFFPRLLRDVPALRVLLLMVALLCGVILAGFLVCIFLPPSEGSWMRKLLRVLPWRNLAERTLGVISVYRNTPGTLLMALALSMCANLSVVVVTALGVLAMNPGALSLKMCLVIPIGHVVNSIPLTPGGLGVGEAAFNALFRLTGLSGGAEALLCWRVWNAMVGVLGLFFYMRGIGRVVFDRGMGAPLEKLETQGGRQSE